MKKRIVFMISIMIAFMLSGVCIADDFNGDLLFCEGYEYYLNEDGTVDISDWTGEGDTLEIPDEIDGHKVVEVYNRFSSNPNVKNIKFPSSVNEIGDGVLASFGNMQHVIVSTDNTNYAVINNVLFDKNSKKLVSYPPGLDDEEYDIPDGIKEVGMYAFLQCGLRSIEIPDSVIEIGEGAFNWCYNLENIEIPKSVETIGLFAFDSPSISSITVSPENEVFSSINNVLFKNSGEILFYFPRGLQITNYIIPDGTKKFGRYAFYNCDLEGIVIPDSVIEIADCAFYGCSDLEGIEIPVSVTLIGNNAFRGCSELKKLIIPDSVTTIGSSAFSECDNLSLIVGHDSYAEQYAQQNDLYYTYSEAADWLNE